MLVEIPQIHGYIAVDVDDFAALELGTGANPAPADASSYWRNHGVVDMSAGNGRVECCIETMYGCSDLR